MGGAYGKVSSCHFWMVLLVSCRVADVVVTRDVDVTKKCQKLLDDLGVAGAILFHKGGSVFCGRRSTWERNRMASAAKRADVTDVTLRGRRKTSDRYIQIHLRFLPFSHWNICPVTVVDCCCMY